MSQGVRLDIRPLQAYLSIARQLSMTSWDTLYQTALTEEQQTIMNAYVEAVYGKIVLKLKKFLVQEGGNKIIVDGTQNFFYIFYDTVGEGHGSNRGKSDINISPGGTSKFSYPNQGKWLSRGILAGLAWIFLTLLAVGADLLRDFLPPDTTWFKIHEYCNRLNFFFTITYFSLAVHVLDKSGRKQFSFKHESMVLDIFIIVFFQVLAGFNRPHIPPPP